MDRISSLAVHSLLYLLYAALSCLLAVADARAADPVAHFNLPSEPLPQALIDFYHQSGVEPGFSPTPQMQKAKSNPVAGQMAGSAALALLLKGTGYTFRVDTGNSVDVIPAGQPGAMRALAAARTPRVHAAPPRAARASRDYGRLEQVDVTGSLIPGVQDTVAPLVYLKRQQLAMASYPTIQDALYSLPIISLDGPRADLGIDAIYQ